jgi:2-deoxy-D-gluconate 3-dehydrogenase
VSAFQLTGKAAIVTGGNGGIGLGMAEGLARAGAHVAIVARNAEKSREAVEKLRSIAAVRATQHEGDLSQQADIERVVREVADAHGRIDILINNAGINIRKVPHEMTLDEWQQVIDINLTSVFLFAKAVYPYMRIAGGGKIINIGSMTSIFGAAFAPAYASSKGAVVQLTKSLALAWAGDRIQVNAILPGWFDTDLTIQARKEIPGLHERVIQRIPEGRWGRPEDIAGTAVWLASPASDYVTGIAVPVDGGYTAAL